jgi:diguanylate cyclase (GGDEF)-like protein/PAS domain S-box-containing protein
MLPVKQRAVVSVMVTAAVAASATYAWRTRVPFEQAQRWLVLPALAATVAALWGSRLRSNGDRVAWLAIAGSCAMTTASYALTFADAAFDAATLDGLAGLLRAPDRTLIALGLISMIAERSPIRERYLAIEATIVSLTATVVMWVFLIEPALGRSTLTDADRMLSLALPASDLVLVALAARLSLGYQARNRSFSILLVGLVVRLLANILSYWSYMADGVKGGPMIHALTAISLLLFAVAALDRTGAQRPVVAQHSVQLDRLRLTTIALCALTPQAVLISLIVSDDAPRSTVLFAGVVTALVTMLALTRLWGLALSVRDLTERRGKDRLASLVERSSDIVVLVDGNHRVSYTSGAVATVLGVDSQDWVGLRLHDLELTPLVDTWSEVAERILTQMPDGTLTVEATAHHSNGTPRLLEMTAVNLVQNVAVAGVVITMRDVTATHSLQRQLSFRADHDELTGLANRAQFLSRLTRELAGHQRPVVMFMDLDDFKVINDTMGHEAGDVLLRTIAERLARRIPATSGLVARLGGDEFAALLPVATTAQAAALAADFLADLREPVVLSQFHTVSASCSVGIARPEEGETASAVLRNADFAMYRAKRRGKSFIEVFDAELEHEIARTEEYRRDLVSALGRDQFALVYQPIVRVHDSRLVGAEALLRWNHHVYGAVAPGDFVEIAEQTGVIIPIGWWSIRQACLTAASWLDDSLFVTVNVSGCALRGASIVEHVRQALEESGLAPHRLVLEITESVLIDDPDGVAAELVGVRAMGVRVALDDFGTGYSSLAYVQRLPLDIIKIDREFVQSLGRQADDALTRIIVTMAHNLGLETIGEGVEEESQVIGLAEIGCDYTQGFLFSEPLTASSMAAMLEDLADRDHVRQPVDLVIAVDAAPSPIVIAPPTAAAAPPTGSSSAAAPPVSTRRAVRSSTPAAQPAAPAAPEAPASVESTAPAAPLSAPASPLPKTRRRTGRDEQPARPVRPLISTSSSDDTDARHDA